MKIRAIIIMLLCLAVLAGCGGKKGYKDGTYTGTAESQHSRMEVTLIIKDNQITACEMKSYGKDGKLKDESYGEGMDDKNKELAQMAYQGFSQYAALLVEKQDIEAVDAISGATVSHKEFTQAVKDALNQAK